ncbi:hypothetical protein D9758_018082 [Tetrapyrgos nigripes]|uniref:Uncharacterized protein n=1 Tax=Tetrapyrgos nigripes TaxID=182062 RepID=A0A8H5BBP4_9AGAR|nr:hypothetical protein D9758_018082 [Tetrapyrgos nigripes]
MAEPVRMLVDDSRLTGSLSDHLGLACPGWDLSNHTQDSGLFHNFFNNGSYTSVTSPFSCIIDWVQGPVTFFGIAPPLGFNQSFALNGHIFNYSQPGHQGQLFDLPEISTSGGILPTVDLGSFAIVDYALFTVDNSSDLSDSLILVDDSSKEIQWNGSWEPGPPILDKQTGIMEFPVSSISVSPHDNTSHVSSTKGDSFMFRFAGTSIEVYGFLAVSSSTGPGPFTSIQATIDGQQNTNPNLINAPDVRFLLFSRNDLGLGNHTLVFTIEELRNGTSVAIDYILYAPSFRTIVDKPVFETSSASSSNPTAIEPSPDSGHSSKPNVGAIVGGVIGGLVACGLIILGLWLWRRMQKRRILKRHSTLVAEPFMGQKSSTKQPAIPRDHSRPLPAPARSFHNHVTEEWTTDEKGRRQVLQVPTSNTEHRNIQEYSQALEEQMPQIEIRSQAGNVDVNHLDAEMREMRATVDMLRREMGRILVPPSYDSESGSVSGD